MPHSIVDRWDEDGGLRKQTRTQYVRACALWCYILMKDYENKLFFRVMCADESCTMRPGLFIQKANGSIFI